MMREEYSRLQSEKKSNPTIIQSLIEEERIRQIVREEIELNYLHQTVQEAKKVNRSRMSGYINKSVIGWPPGKENSLEIFYSALVKYRLLFCGSDLFKSHFIGVELPREKIIWPNPINELVYMFVRLRKENIIPPSEEKHKQLCVHFLNQYGEPLDNRSLAVHLQKGVADDDRVQLLEKIILEVLKHS